MHVTISYALARLDYSFYANHVLNKIQKQVADLVLDALECW